MSALASMQDDVGGVWRICDTGAASDLSGGLPSISRSLGGGVRLLLLLLLIAARRRRSLL